MKNIIILLLLFGISFSVSAQKDKHERIKALKVAHITEALELTADEAAKFWPVYNAYDDKKHNLRKRERNEIMKPLRDNGLDTMSDADANALIDKAIEFKKHEVAYRNALLNDLRKAISPKKVIKLKRAEDDFKRQLLERYKGKRKK